MSPPPDKEFHESRDYFCLVHHWILTPYPSLSIRWHSLNICRVKENMNLSQAFWFFMCLGTWSSKLDIVCDKTVSLSGSPGWKLYFSLQKKFLDEAEIGYTPTLLIWSNAASFCRGQQSHTGFTHIYHISKGVHSTGVRLWEFSKELDIQGPQSSKNSPF